MGGVISVVFVVLVVINVEQMIKEISTKLRLHNLNSLTRKYQNHNNIPKGFTMKNIFIKVSFNVTKDLRTYSYHALKGTK